MPRAPQGIDRVVDSVERCRDEIAQRCVQVLLHAGSRLAWESVMLDQFRAQVGRVLDDTVATLRGGAEAEAVQQPQPASVEIGADHARHGIHIAESLQADRVLFEVTLETVIDDLGASADGEDVQRLSIAMNGGISRRAIVAAKAYFTTWLDQIHSGHAEQRLRIMRELTEVSRDQLVSAIHTVIHGDGRAAPNPPEQAPGGLPQPGGAAGPDLTAREQEVLELAARAMTTRQIAEVLVIAEGTVRRHLGNSYKKLGAAGRLDAVIHAVSAGLISPAALADEFIPGSVPHPRRSRRVEHGDGAPQADS